MLGFTCSGSLTSGKGLATSNSLSRCRMSSQTAKLLLILRKSVSMVSTKIFQVTSNCLLILFQWYYPSWWRCCNKNPCPSIHTFQLEIVHSMSRSQRLSSLHSAILQKRWVMMPRSLWLAWCLRAQGTAQGILHHWSPETSQSPLQDAVTSSNPVIPSSPATFGHQHSVSLLSALKTLWTPRACPDPHSTRKPHLEGCEQTCLSAQATSYELSWNTTL